MAPKRHAFDYPVYMMYLDLAELPEPFGRSRAVLGAAARRPPASAAPTILGDPATPLEPGVRDLVQSETGERPAGPIRLLTNLRTSATTSTRSASITASTPTASG